MIALDIRLIDRQQTRYAILEVYAGPDGRRVRFFAGGGEAISQVWSGSEWNEVHRLVWEGPNPTPEEAIRRLFSPTEDILGWSKSHG